MDHVGKYREDYGTETEEISGFNLSKAIKIGIIWNMSLYL